MASDSYARLTKPVRFCRCAKCGGVFNPADSAKVDCGRNACACADPVAEVRRVTVVSTVIQSVPARLVHER